MLKILSFKSWPLWAQITSVLFIICCCIVLATGEYVRRIENHFLIESLEQNQQRILNTIASTAIESIIIEDIATLDTIVSELVEQNTDIYSFSITNEEHKSLIKRSNTKPVNKKYSLIHSAPIKYENEIFGYIDIRWDMTQKYTEVEKHIRDIYFFISMMLILLSGISAIGIHLLVTRPLRNIENRLLGHATGDSTNYKDKMLSHEFIQLYKTIDKLEALTTSKEELQKEVIQRKKTQIELAKARDAAIKASRAKSTFLAKMSHELRTPLNAIIGYSELIAEDAEDEGHETCNLDAKKITSAGKHLLELINNILDLSKIEAGKMELSLEIIDLASLIQSITNTITPLISKNENKLEVICPENIGVIQNDKMKLKQIILNLLSNACKFTQHGVISLNIQRFSRQDSNWITICIKDTGIGISRDNLEHIFDSFSQADNSTSSNYGGTGLGLSISQNFSQMMGGDMKVESELDKGSRFCIQIPAIVQKAQQVEPVETINQNPPLLKAEQIRFNSSTKNIPLPEDRRKKISHVFIIETDTEQQEQIKLVLETEGLKVDSERNIERALEKIKKNSPDIIVINTVSMNEKSISFLNQITSDKKLKNIPLITIVEDTLSTHFLIEGASHQLPRRYEINDLLDKIKLSLRKSQ